ncbi:hypothetical protein [Streptomyces sp. NPDC051132]|uniref:hypothetical protein n=1 Tax=unclassified Streptomyces TaxID=2593676 RepID=UPI00342CC539
MHRQLAPAKPRKPAPAGSATRGAGEPVTGPVVTHGQDQPSHGCLAETELIMDG